MSAFLTREARRRSSFSSLSRSIVRFKRSFSSRSDTASRSYSALISASTRFCSSDLAGREAETSTVMPAFFAAARTASGCFLSMLRYLFW